MFKIGDLVKLRPDWLMVEASVDLVHWLYSRTIFPNEIGLYLGTVNLAEYKSEKPGPWNDIVLIGEEKMQVPQGALVKAEISDFV